jgi:hypothetical protein
LNGGKISTKTTSEAYRWKFSQEIFLRFMNSSSMELEVWGINAMTVIDYPVDLWTEYIRTV